MKTQLTLTFLKVAALAAAGYLLFSGFSRALALLTRALQ